MGNGPIYNGGKCENLKAYFFVDKNRSKFVHTSSIYAGYTPLGGLFNKNIKFLPKKK